MPADLASRPINPTPMLLLLSVHPSRTADLATPHKLLYEPYVEARDYRDGEPRQPPLLEALLDELGQQLQGLAHRQRS